MASKSLQGVSSLEDFELSGKKVFLRLDLNVPLKDGEILDDTRIQAALPTIRYALDHGAKLMLASHLGRPKTKEDREKLSMVPIAEALNEHLGIDSMLIEDMEGDAAKALFSGLKSNQILVLENLRFHDGETQNDLTLAQKLSTNLDIYINDAFGASHRAHMSVVALPACFEKRGMGFLMKKEIEMLDHLLNSAEAPFVAVLGGAKVSDKIPVIENLLDQVDGFVIGGAMAYTFLAAQNIPVGSSLVEKDHLSFAKNLIKRMEGRDKKLLLPIDHRCVSAISSPETLEVSKTAAVPEGMMGVDIGPKSEELFSEYLSNAKTIFWNGPMGIFETPEYASGTFAVAKAVGESEAMSIVGGGDSASAAQKSGYADKMSHISTGGGASLEYIQGIKLPGLEALKPIKKSETENGMDLGGLE